MGTRIVLADDSLVFRKVMKQVVEETFDVEEIRLASSGAEALALIEESCPDLLFTDMEMPGMSGLELVDAVKRGGHACKMIVVSGVMNRSGIDLTVKALSAGAIAFIHKPEGGGFQASVDLLKESLGSALDGIRDSRAVTHVPATPAPPPRRPRPGRREWKFRVVVVAVSTGGPEALSRLIPALPEDFPLPILVVQHMPASFTPSFARNLDRRSALNVVEAEAGMTPQAGTVYLAPGGIHMVLDGRHALERLEMDDGPPECSVKPSADVLFRSVATAYRNRDVLALVLTGMGEDGTRGLRELKENNCYCITQSEDSCVVYGMPRMVDEAGLSDESAPIDAIAGRLVALTSNLGVKA